MGKHVVSRLSEFPPGSRKIVEAERRSIGVFNIEGDFYALRNSCPHQGAPLCIGRVMGQTFADRPYELQYNDQDLIVKCPWHGWEFSVATGESVFNPHRVRVRSYEVTVELLDGILGEEDPNVETFTVTVEDGWVILHV